MGNDVNDVECLKWSGVAIGPSDALTALDSVLHWRTERPGGHGAVREVCEALIRVKRSKA